MGAQPLTGLLDAENEGDCRHQAANPQMAAGAGLGVMLKDDLAHGVLLADGRTLRAPFL